MNLQEIINDLKKRFNEDYPEFYNRRIIIWMDQDREFEDFIDDIEIEGVKILKMEQNNTFQVKKTLVYDDTESDYMLYCPLYFEKGEDNWIMDIFKYSEEFRADRVSIEISEMGLNDTVSIRREVKKYKKFFNAKKRREDIKKLANRFDNSGKLILAIMSSIARCELDPANIIREVIKAGIYKDENHIYQQFINYKIDGEFWNLCNQGTGYMEEEKEIKNLFANILLTASSRNIDKEAFIGLDQFIDTYHETFCFQFIEDWIRDSKDKNIFKRLSRTVEQEVNLYERLQKIELYGIEKSDFFLCIDEVILHKLMTNIKNDIIDPEMLIKTIDARRVTSWYEDFESYYEGIYYMAKMKEFYNKNQKSFHELEAEKLWKLYATDFYMMDTYYRKFQRAFQESLTNSNIRLDDIFKVVVERAEGIYKYWFLDELLTNWCNVAGKAFENHGYISNIMQQKDFYRSNIKNAKTKIFVIISDAMRYEVGVELTENLRREMQCKVEIKNMEGIFPTITSFGMAALLPNKRIETEVKNDSLKVLIDGERTDANYRKKILKKGNENSIVLKYDDLIQMKRDERKEKVKGMDVVYIYHNRIDDAGHGTGYEVFSACDTAINEIKNLVRIIVNEFSGVNIMITSDHGFIYTYNAFTEEDKVARVGFDGVVEVGRRYAIMNDIAKPKFLMPIKFIDENVGLKGFSPRENIRIKKQGGGINFVHGGISLQEMVVPLIHYKHLRNDSKEYQRNKSRIDLKPVQLKVLSSIRKISNMIFNMSFYQSEMLSENREAANFTLYFVDEYGKKISNEVRIIADRNNLDDETDRRFDVRFNLKACNYDKKKAYYLMIIEESGKITPEKIEFAIDIPFATGEYDFFN